jgi:hypothetical protein
MPNHCDGGKSEARSGQGMGTRAPKVPVAQLLDPNHATIRIQMFDALPAAWLTSRMLLLLATAVSRVCSPDAAAHAYRGALL